MRPYLPVLIALASSQSAAVGQVAEPATRAVTLAAARAIEGDSVGAVRVRWTARAETGDRSAQLGLATLDRLSYRYSLAEKRYHELISAKPDDQWAVASWVGLGYGSFPHGSVVAAHDYFAKATAAAAVAGDTVQLVEATTARGVMIARLVSADSALELIESLGPLIPPTDQWLRAQFLCRRAAIGGPVGLASAPADAETGARLAVEAGDARLAASCQMTLGILHSQRGRLDSAYHFLVAAAKAQIRLRDLQNYATTMQWQGSLRASYGSLSMAGSALAYSTAAADTSGNEAAKAWGLIAHSQLSASIRDFPAAEAALARAEHIFEATGDRSGAFTSRNQRAFLRRVQGRLPEARRLYEQSLAESGRFAGTWRVGVLRALGNIRAGQGDYSGADSLLDAAGRLADSLGLRGQRLGMEFDRAEVALGRGNLVEAGAALRDQLRRLGNFTPLTHYDQYQTLASIELAAARPALAETLLIKGAAALETWRERLSDERFRLHTFAVADNRLGTKRWAGTIAKLVGGGRISPAFELVERRRARLLLDRLVQATASQDDSSALATVHQARQIGAKSLRLDEVKAALLPSQALLLFLTGGGTAPSVVFAVTRNGADGYLVPTADSLRGAVSRFIKLLEAGIYPDSLAEALGQAVLGQALGHLENQITSLIIVPDGPLHLLPFEPLRVRGRLLAERFAVTIAPSATVALRPVSTRPDLSRPVAILAFGDPTFPESQPAAGDPAASLRAWGASGLPRLPGTADEVALIGRFSDRSHVRRQDEASEAAFKGLDLAAYGVIHLATHALVDDQSAARTGLALAAGGGEDGVVTAADLANRKLTASLVVLSACRTARGVVLDGEGIQGLTAPLLGAGARAVVATLWPVDDGRTKAFVELLYRQLATGATVAAALQAAKLEAVRVGISSAEWASFVVVGDGETVVPLGSGRRPAGLEVALVVVALGVAGALAWWRRRRH